MGLERISESGLPYGCRTAGRQANTRVHSPAVADPSRERDPNHPLLIDNYVRVPIIVNAAITVDPRYSNASVQQAALAALLFALSFDELQFAQPIYLSHIYAALQDVDGVVSVNIADLNFKNQDPLFRKAHGADASKLQAHLFMLPARPGTLPGTVLPAELAWVEIASQDIIVTASGGV